MITKREVKGIFFYLSFLFWGRRVYQFQHLSGRVLLARGIVQKIFRINAHVPWPVHFTTQVLCPEKIEIGSRTPGGAMGCFIDGRNGIKIGHNVWIGPRVTIISQDHENDNFNNYKIEDPISIGSNCILCTNAIILPSVKLGEHTIVAAGAIVTRSFPEGNVILAGNPAKVVRKLKSYSGK